MVNPSAKVHLGCGLNTPEGWINIDGSWNARLAKHPQLRRLLKALRILPASMLDVPWSREILIHDVRRPLPIQGNLVHAIYSSHMLEHLYLEDGKRLLQECFRVLKPGGILRIVVPDLRAIILEYLGETSLPGSAELAETMSGADRLNHRLFLRSPNQPRRNLFYSVYNAWNDLHEHKWMYDSDSLVRYFQWAGFIDVQEMPFRQSRIEGVEKVEEAGRVLNGAGICVEGIKPENGAGPV